MKMRRYNASNEYLDTLCERLLEWAKKPASLTVPQFLESQGLGYPFFKYFCHVSDKVNNTFEVVKSILHNRWFSLGMNEEAFPPHQAKLLMRYIRYYDSHGLDTEQMMREAQAEAEANAHRKTIAENYAAEELQQPYRRIYEQNDDKRRGGSEAQ